MNVSNNHSSGLTLHTSPKMTVLTLRHSLSFAVSPFMRTFIHRRSKLKASERRTLRSLGEQMIELRYNYPRRFANALLALAKMDPRWMVWVENSLPPKLEDVFKPRNFRRLLCLIEARAHYLVLKNYNFFHHDTIGWLIFRQDWPFNDNGSLTPG